MLELSKWFKAMGAGALCASLLLVAFGGSGCDDGDGDGDSDADVDGDGDVDGDADGDVDGDVDGDGDGDSDSDGEDQIVSLTIVHTSDLHHHASGVGPLSDYTPLDTEDSDTILGGYARLATLIDSIRTEQEAAGVPVLVVDSGDYLMGTIYDMTVQSPLAYHFFQAVGYDAITLGNHEFDWGPDGLAQLLGAAQAADPAFDVPIVATNTITSTESADDDSVEALFTSGAIHNELVLTLDNGLRVGILGVVGENADEDAPTADPISFNHRRDFLAEAITGLRENADFVLLLSHSGISADAQSGEDVVLAEHLDIDVIASGHSHIPTSEEIVVGETIVMQPGEYGEWLARIDITFNVTQGRIESHEFELIPVDDSIDGDTTMQATIDAVHTALDPQIEALFGVTTRAPVAELGFDLDRLSQTETGIGNLCADATRAAATLAVQQTDDTTPFAVGVVPNGVIRHDVHAAQDGTVSFSDLFNVLPLGLSPDPENQTATGWPLVSVYLTAEELRMVAEVTATAAGIVGDSAYLNVSGIRYEYNGAANPLERVTTVMLCGNSLPTAMGGDEDPFGLACDVPLNFEDTTTLHRLVTDLYTLMMMDLVARFGFTIEPKTSDGTTIDLDDPADYMLARVDADPATDGIQELKNWAALLGFITALADGGGDENLPDIPGAIYDANGAGFGRSTATE